MFKFFAQYIYFLQHHFYQSDTNDPTVEDDNENHSSSYNLIVDEMDESTNQSEQEDSGENV